VIQLGENPEYAFNVGALGVSNIRNLPLLKQEELEKQINFRMGENCLLTTFHPVTLENNTAGTQLEELFAALDNVDAQCIFTKANTDTEGRIINSMIDEYVQKNPTRAIAFTSMGNLRYLSAMRCCGAVVGNSSSGILEAPSFGVPTVNIGDRQKGRTQAASVLNCTSQAQDIEKTLKKALFSDFRTVAKETISPYEKTGTVELIMAAIGTYKDKLNVQKHFYDIPITLE